MNKILQENLNYKKFIVDSRLQYFKPHSTRIEKTFAEEITTGLSSAPKFILPKFFYDNKGSGLFEKICLLPEYYPTRSEIAILKNLQNDLSKYIDKDCRLVELGSGSSTKTRLLLDVFDKLNSIEYCPIDISEILTESSESLLAEYKKLHVTGIVDTYEGGIEFFKQLDGKSFIIFLGSSYGNLSPSAGNNFLKTIYSAMKPGDLFLIGLDLVKDTNILESAYNDSAGVTARFNLNVLSRINNELDADFDLDNFEHHAVYNSKKQRIEMYVKSLVDQSVTLAKSGKIIKLKRGELVSTEHSYKFHITQIQDMLQKVGFKIQQIWQDENRYFSLTLVSKGPERI